MDVIPMPRPKVSNFTYRRRQTGRKGFLASMISSAATDEGTTTATGLVARPSLDYVMSAFKMYEARRPFVTIVSPDAAPTLAGVRIDAIVEPVGGAGWFRKPQAVRHGGDIAQIVFTSGTTGRPKGIILTHDALADTTLRLIDVQRLTSSVREYVGVPPNYSFGLGRYRAVAAVGGESFMPAHGFDPSEIGRMLRNREINALSAVPTLMRVLIDQADLIGTAGRNMRWIEIGSQHMTRAEKESVKAIFPEARIIQHYGLTEASRTTFLNISEISGCQLESVGRPIGETEIGLSPEGCVRIRGPHVAREWIGFDGVSQLLDQDGWLTTNDLGTIENGFLYFQGRADDLINFGGIKLVPDLIEDRLRSRYAAPPRLAVARINDPLRGDGVLVATDDADVRVDTLRSLTLDVLASFGVAAGDGLCVAAVSKLPFTATGKIQRQALADTFAAEFVDPPIGLTADDQSMSEVLQAFRLAFPRRVVGRGDSLMSLGGDSLAHVSIFSRLDEPAGRLPVAWEDYSIADLEILLSAAPSVPTTRSTWRLMNSEIVLRAAAVSLIVAHHALRRDLGGGIDVLLLLVGFNLARFQTKRLASPRRWSLVRDMILKMVVPYYLLLILFAVAFHHSVSAADVFLVSNFEGRFNSLEMAALWFVPAYLQSILILAVLATAAPVRRSIAERPSLFGYALLAGTLLIKLLALLIFAHGSLLGRTPDQFLYIVALGWCIYEARSTTARLLSAAVALAVMLLDGTGIAGRWFGFDGRWHTTALFGATLILLYLPVIQLPRLLGTAAVRVAMASLMIYMTHPLLIRLLTPLFRQPLTIVPHERFFLLIMSITIIVIGIVFNDLFAAGLRHSPQVRALFKSSR